MTKTIISLVFMALLVVGAAGIATWALFTDTEESTDNQLVAGSLDLRTDDADGVTQTLYATSMAPGDTVGPATIVLSNAGTMNGSSLDLSFSYVENDGGSNEVDMTADEMAAMIEVTTLSYDGSSILGSVSDSNANGYVDVQDLTTADLSGQSGLTTVETKDYVIAVQFRSDVGNDYQGDGITMTMTFVLNQ